MRSHQYNAFIADLYRYRPLIVVVLSVIVILPSLNEMFGQGLSVLIVLFRFAEAMFAISILVWLVSSVLLRYARIQARTEIVNDRQGELDS